MIYFFNKNTMSAFQLFENILPDDIVELIYTKIVYDNPKNLLDQIKYYHKILKYIKIKCNNDIIFDRETQKAHICCYTEMTILLLFL